MNVVGRSRRASRPPAALDSRASQMSVSSTMLLFELVAMTPAEDFSAVPPFEIRESAEQRVPFVFNSPHSGRHYPERFLAMTRLDRNRDPPLRGLLTSTSCSAAAVPLGAPLLGREFSARLSRREPRAVGTRPAHVRRAGAVLRQHPLGAGCRRARHGAEAGRRGARHLFRPAAAGRGAWRASRRSTSPITRR